MGRRCLRRSGAGSERRRPNRRPEDVKLLEQLLTATNGSYSRNGTFADPRAIKVMLASVPLDTVVNIVKWKVNLLSYPKNPTIASWSGACSSRR